MSREEPPWLFSESTSQLSSAFYTPRAPHSDLHSNNPLSNSGRHMRRRWGPPPYLLSLGRPYGGSKGALVANFGDRHTPHRFCAAAAIRRPPIDPVKALCTNVAHKYP